MTELISAAQRYASLETDRNPFLTRARDCALLTIPYLMPPEGSGPSTEFNTPYQSLGAMGVQTLAAKLLVAMFPPNTPFFRYLVDDLILEDLGSARGDAEKALVGREKAVMTEVESAAFRPVAYVAFQHLINNGNALVYVPPDTGASRLFRLDQYVVKRSPNGDILEIVVKEKVATSSLPLDIRAQVEATLAEDKPAGGPDLRTTDLFTYVGRIPDSEDWEVWQEAGGKRIQGTEGTYKPHTMPWIPLRFIAQPGEDYGRSYVEQYLGDLDSLEGLSEAIVEGSAASARVVFMVSPNGVTNIRVISRAKSGDVVSGEAADVSTLQVQKQADLRVAMEQAQEISQRLARAFMLQQSVQRNGERVTAEEIRTVASDLDDSLGGVYTLLASTFQLPVVRLFERRMEKRVKVKPLPEKVAKPVVVTGLSAIGRGTDLRNLRSLLADLSATFGPEAVARLLNVEEAIKRIAAAYGVDPANLIRPQQDPAQQTEQAQMMELVKSLGPDAIKTMGSMATTAMKQP